MQLVEDGKLDLTADVNTYLSDVQIPATYEEPITLEHLMAHTAGFEEWTIGLMARDSTDLRPLDELLREKMPERVRPPGEASAYSNYGNGLAAHVVEQVSGQPFAAYVRQHILEPLGMSRTTFRQPLPPVLREDLAQGYRYRDGIFVEGPDRYIQMPPMGGASSTATDMARFMLAHLNEGHLGAAAVLDSATARLMHSPLYEPAPGVSPMAHGFSVERHGNQEAIGHGGALWEYHSMLLLLPEHETGLFVSFNGDRGRAAHGDLVEAFTSHYFPAPSPFPSPPAAHAEGRLDRFAGVYQRTRRAQTTLGKLAALLLSIPVSVTDEGLLKTGGAKAGQWIPTEHPLTFREEGGRGLLSFKEGENGTPEYLYFGNAPYNAYDRAETLSLPSVNAAIFLGAFFLLSGTLFSWPLAAIIRRRHGVRLAKNRRLPIASYGLAWGACLVLLVVIVTLAVLLTRPDPVLYGVSAGLRALLWLPFIAAGLSIGALVYAVRHWTRGQGSLGQRLYFSLVTLGCLVVLAQLSYWNLLGFHY